jgi:hypothetical protein
LYGGWLSEVAVPLPWQTEVPPAWMCRRSAPQRPFPDKKARGERLAPAHDGAPMIIVQAFMQNMHAGHRFHAHAKCERHKSTICAFTRRTLDIEVMHMQNTHTGHRQCVLDNKKDIQDEYSTLQCTTQTGGQTG